MNQIPAVNIAETPLEWGLNTKESLTKSVKWGARTVLYQDHFDILGDRQAYIGGQAELSTLIQWINKGVLQQAQLNVKLLREGMHMQSDVDQEFTLYTDDYGTVLGNTRGSCGYLYIVAYRNRE
jgi:hypothetical protein